MIDRYIRRDLIDFNSYLVDLLEYKVKLDANESPYGFNEEIKNQLCDLIKKEEFNRYPDTECNDLREEIANFWNVKKENVICGVGSDQLIDCILKLFIEVNNKVMIPKPSFSMYKITTVMNHGIPCEYDLNNDFSYNTQKIIEHYKKLNPKVLILCTPNNPTGNKIDKVELKEILKNVSCPVIIDEAYGEFNNETMIDLIDEFENLIVLRTFSKLYGLAGLRVGYAISNTNLINLIKITTPPYNLNTFSEKVATIILKNKNLYQDIAKKIMKEKSWLENELKKINNLEVFDSCANFILVKSQLKDLAEKLKEKGILVRGFPRDDRLKDYVRISIGFRKENEILLVAVKELHNNE